MDQTPNLALPYIAPSQAQKHVTHNEALRALDAIVQIGVLDRDVATPPDTPAEGDRYVVASDPAGAWDGHANHIAAWQDGAWMFYEPRKGWLAWIADEGRLCAWDGDSWVVAGGGGGSGDSSLATLGINATADTTNRLVVKSEASLFDHDSAGHQHKINKKLATDTASVLFQTEYSGRAEFGTAGDDDFHVKVSADGATWKEALVIDRATGVATFPFTPRREVLTANRTYYVRTDGSDDNDGLTDSSGGALLTIQKAINVVAALDLSVYNVTIRIGAGTYTGSTIANITAPWVGAGTVTLLGVPGTILQASIICVQANGVGSRIVIAGIDIRSTVLGIQAVNGGQIGFGPSLVFGTCGAEHIRSNGPGSKVVTNGQTYTINGDGARHYSASPGGFIDGTSSTVTLSGTPGFAAGFCFADRGGLATFLAASFSGAANGPRYNVSSNAVINTAGGGANFFPGSTAGSTSTGGLYI